MDSEKKFQAEVIGIIEETLSEKFGPDVVKVLFYNFLRTTMLQKEEMIRKPEQFDYFLSSMFGMGSQLIRRTMIIGIQNRFHLDDQIDTAPETLASIIRRAWRARQATLS